MMRATIAFLCGVLFAVGLALAGMTTPEKIVAFLDVSGAWDPSLALVMIGAIGVYLPLYRLARRRSRPVLAPGFVLSNNTRIDRTLLAGAAIFGIGWGAIGYCPGPALVSVGAGSTPAAIFVAGMFGAMAALELLAYRSGRQGMPPAE